MKRYLTNMVISAVKPKVNTTTLGIAKSKLAKKAKRDLKLAIQKNKSSKAKLDQSIFEFKKNEKFTFPTKTKKTMSNTELKDQADYLNKTGKYKVKKKEKK